MFGELDDAGNLVCGICGKAILPTQRVAREPYRLDWVTVTGHAHEGCATKLIAQLDAKLTPPE